MKKVAIFIGVIVLSIALVAVIIFLNSKPNAMSEAQKEKAVSDILGRKANINPKVQTGNSIYDGEYISFNYPKAAEIYEYVDPAAKNNDSILESFSFDIKNPRLILNYTVIKFPSELLDNPSVRLRELESSGYKKEEIKIGEILAKTYQKQGDSEFRSEKSIFFKKDSRLYSITITGNSMQDIEDLFNELTKSIEVK